MNVPGCFLYIIIFFLCVVGYQTSFQEDIATEKQNSKVTTNINNLEK